MSNHLIEPGDTVRWNDPDGVLCSTEYVVARVYGRFWSGGHSDAVRMVDTNGHLYEALMTELEVVNRPARHSFNMEQAKNAVMEHIDTWDSMELATLLAECYPGERVTVDSSTRMYDDATSKMADIVIDGPIH